MLGKPDLDDSIRRFLKSLDVSWRGDHVGGMGDRIELVLRILGTTEGSNGEQGPDDTELAAMTRNLRAGLLTLDVDDVRPAPGGPAPAGAKAAETVLTGALLVALAPPLIGGVIDVVASWLKRQVIDVEVDIGGHRLKGTVTGQQRDALVAAFLDRTRPDQVAAEPSPDPDRNQQADGAVT
jgi:hypothetical protein